MVEIVRARDSVEGRAADSNAEFARFLRVSFKSSNELCYQLETAVSRGLIPAKVFKRFRIQIIEVQVLLDAFIRKLQRDDRSGPDRAGSNALGFGVFSAVALLRAARANA
jgi:hypothetical protein